MIRSKYTYTFYLPIMFNLIDYIVMLLCMMYNVCTTYIKSGFIFLFIPRHSLLYSYDVRGTI